MIDQTTEGGKALQAVVKTELKQYLGQDYNDDVLPLYIVVMLAHGNQLPLVKDNLEAFLGQEKATAFADWLFDHLNDNLEKYDPSAAKEAAEVVEAEKQAQPAEVPEEQDSGQKRSREKREKIEWKGEKTQNRLDYRDSDAHEEKRRRSGDRIERSYRGEPEWPRRDSYGERDRERYRERNRDSERDRDRDRDRDRYRRRSPDRREDDPRSRFHDRYERPSREPDRMRSDRFSTRDRMDYDGNGRDKWGDDRDFRRYSPESPHERGPVPQRLAGRVGQARSPEETRSASSTPPRAAAKPSVFDRLKRPTQESERRKPNGLDKAIQTRMRMDAVGKSKAADVSPEFPSENFESDLDDNGPAAENLPATPKDQPAALQTVPSNTGQEEVASELRQIREQLAKLNAERAEKRNMEMANQLARKVVVQNVHFNATPDILKAHFSGCGSIISAVIEKEATGRPKGVAIVEFETEEARRVALTLSGSLLLGRPITVLAKEPTKRRSAPAFYPPAVEPNFRPRAPSFIRGRGRAPFPGRHTLKNNKYVRPTEETANGSAAKTSA